MKLSEFRVVVFDPSRTRENISKALTHASFKVIGTDSISETLKNISDQISVVVAEWTADWKVLIEKIRHQERKTQIIFLCSQVVTDQLNEAVEEGAFWCIYDPIEPEHLAYLATKAAVIWELSEEVESLRAALETPPSSVAKLIGKSEKLKALITRMEKAAHVDSTILLTGESGTGKSTIARILHELSDRKGKPFVSVSCAAIPRELIEAELFGHTKGAFTHAIRARPGAIEFATEGTLFLDEIGELPLELQPKLLTFLQDRTIRRIGDNEERAVNVRIITATNRDLEEMVQHKSFREDLYYRLNVLRLEVPSLRERIDDIIPLADEILKRNATRRARGQIKLSSAAKDALLDYSWPGNIRELENVLERAMTFSEGENILKEDLGLPEKSKKFTSLKNLSLAGISLEDLEIEAIKQSLQLCNWNKESAAKTLGISVKSVYNKIAKFGITES